MRDAGCDKMVGLARLGCRRTGPSLADCTMRAGCGKGGFSFSLPDTSELVILSAAGAKDLLFRRCEDLFRAPQARTTYVAASKNSRSFARARAARALRMTSAASPREKKMENQGIGGVVSLFPPSESERVCHPERRRREGSAFP